MVITLKEVEALLELERARNNAIRNYRKLRQQGAKSKELKAEQFVISRVQSTINDLTNNNAERKTD